MLCPNPNPEGFSRSRQGCSDSSSSPLLLLSSYKGARGQRCPAALARLTPHRLCQQRDQQEKIFIYISRAVTQWQRFTGKKLREEKTPGRKNSRKKTRLDIPGRRGLLPPHSISGRYKIGCDFTKGLGFTVKYQRGARACWNLVLENATGLVEKSIPGAGCVHSHGISTPLVGLRAWKRRLQTCPVLGCMEFSLQQEFCRREGQTQGQDKAKQGSAPLPGTQLLLQPKKLPNPPPLLPRAVTKKAARRFWLFLDLCLKPAQTFIPGSWENPKSF